MAAGRRRDAWESQCASAHSRVSVLVNDVSAQEVRLQRRAAALLAAAVVGLVGADDDELVRQLAPALLGVPRVRGPLAPLLQLAAPLRRLFR